MKTKHTGKLKISSSLGFLRGEMLIRDRLMSQKRKKVWSFVEAGKQESPEEG